MLFFEYEIAYVTVMSGKRNLEQNLCWEIFKVRRTCADNSHDDVCLGSRLRLLSRYVHTYLGVVLPTQQSNNVFWLWKSWCNLGDSGSPLFLKRKGKSSAIFEQVGSISYRSFIKRTFWTPNHECYWLLQIGIVSFGSGCADQRYPGVYVRLGKVLSWIRTVTNDAVYCNMKWNNMFMKLTGCIYICIH